MSAMSPTVLKSMAMLAFFFVAAAESKPCIDFTCPTGHALRSDVMSSQSDFETCCEPIAWDMAQLLVQSAGYSDGNFATFKMNGQLIHNTSQTGLTVIVLRTKGTKMEPNAMESVQTFNTMRNSSGLEAFLKKLPEGSRLLMAVSDSACCKLSETAKSLIEEFGATMIRDVRFRSSYALIGMKGGAAAENLAHKSEGSVSVQTLVPVVDYQERPTCYGRVAVPPVRGVIFNNNWILDAGCRYQLWDHSATQSALAGKWIVFTGASNTMLMFYSLLMLLAEHEQQSVFDQLWTLHVVDIVVEDGQILHVNSISMQQPECKQMQSNSSSFPECQEYLQSFLAKAPAHGKATRLTLILTQFWPAVPFVMETFEADQGWAAAPIGVVVQISSWYLICNYMQFERCPRPELMAESEDETFERFKLELGSAMNKLKTFCGGRAKLGCVVGAASAGRTRDSSLWTAFKRFDNEVGRAVMDHRSSDVRFVDFDELGAGMPEETIMGHGSPSLHIWSWQVMLAGFFPGGPGTGSSRAVFSGPMCSAVNANMTLCPAYNDRCSKYDGCKLWECMNSVRCDFIVTSAASTEIDGTSTTPLGLSDGGRRTTLTLTENVASKTPKLHVQHSIRFLMLCLAGSNMFAWSK